MLEKALFLKENFIILNNPNWESISAGLGPIQQYSIALIALIIIGFILILLKRKWKKRKRLKK